MKLSISMESSSRGKPGTKSKSAPVDEANKQALRAAYAAQKMEKEADAVYEPVQTCNCQDGMVTTLLSAPAPLLDIADAGVVLSPLAAGVSKMLERIGEDKVRLVVWVERVTAE